MKTTTVCLIASLVLSVPIFLSGGEAATVTVDCGSGEKIQQKLDAAKPGDILLVSGTCNEHLVMPEQVQNLTLDGQGKATINGPDGGRNTVLVGGRAITIKRFTISGGRSGISVLRGGSATIDGNTIQNTGNHGIGLHEHSSARIVNNTIQNNAALGILVEETSLARIGFFVVTDPAPRGNNIQKNRGGGIVVRFSSIARMVGNRINNNAGSGIEVTEGSQATLDDNAINENGRDGILVRGNSGVTLVSGRGIFSKPNATENKNSGFGIRCELGGYAVGVVGTLNGNNGAKEFSDTSCIDRLKP